MRHLATIQKIRQINPIENANNIQVCMMEDLEWECVTAKKDNYKVGDFVVYFECDSILPEKEEFEFLRSTKFRIKIRKFCKQISMGLIMPISIIPKGINLEKGLDVTELLCIKKYDSQIQEEKSLVVPKHRSPVLKFLMRNKAFRTVYLKLNSVDKGEWPEWIAKTDEERIQTCAKLLMNNYDASWYITEKLDGSSGTFFTYKRMVWGFSKNSFGVCSRNIWLKTPDNSNYWKVAKNLDIENKIRNIGNGSNVIVQGEILATNIQKNKYKITDPEPRFYVFNLMVDGTLYTYDSMKVVCDTIGLSTVPCIYKSFIPAVAWPDIRNNTSEVVKKMVALSTDKSKLLPEIPREGIVVRMVTNPKISFKVINPEFLLQFGE
jgi:hypothetical protein